MDERWMKDGWTMDEPHQSASAVHRLAAACWSFAATFWESQAPVDECAIVMLNILTVQFPSFSSGLDRCEPQLPSKVVIYVIASDPPHSWGSLIAGDTAVDSWTCAWYTSVLKESDENWELMEHCMTRLSIPLVKLQSQVLQDQQHRPCSLDANAAGKVASAHPAGQALMVTNCWQWWLPTHG